MATYKVPQDVEAEDKLLGPFTFRQFIYLLISAAGIAVIFGLFQIFPLLAIIPVPIVGFFLILALPLKKDQPMEVYLASIASFYLKSNKRLWTPGQKESTIKITAPKIVEKPRARNITEEEASTRLSFLSNLVDSEGYSIRNNSNFNEDFIAETNDVPDILDQNSNQTINQMIAREQENRHANIVSNMKAAISSADQLLPPPSPQMNQSQVDPSNPFQAAIQNLQQGNTTSYQPTAYPQNFAPSPQAYPQNTYPQIHNTINNSSTNHPFLHNPNFIQIPLSPLNRIIRTPLIHLDQPKPLRRNTLMALLIKILTQKLIKGSRILPTIKILPSTPSVSRPTASRTLPQPKIPPRVLVLSLVFSHRPRINFIF